MRPEKDLPKSDLEDSCLRRDDIIYKLYLQKSKVKTCGHGLHYNIQGNKSRDSSKICEMTAGKGKQIWNEDTGKIYIKFEIIQDNLSTAKTYVKFKIMQDILIPRFSYQ